MRKSGRWIWILLVAGSILASVKMIFWGYGLDEEYQILMSYRNLSGDTILGTMWEPHQTSSFLCTALMWIYRFFSPDYTGVVVYLRVWGTLFHLLVSFYLCRVLSGSLKSRYAPLLSLIYYNMLPKQIILPDFSVLQLWSFTLGILFLIRYYCGARRRRYLVLTGAALSAGILAYPSMILHFLPLLLFVWFCSAGSRWKDTAVVAATCAACGLLFLACFAARGDGPGSLLETARRIVAMDFSHETGMEAGKWLSIARGLWSYALWSIGLCLAAYLAVKARNRTACARKREFLLRAASAAVLLSCGAQTLFWVIFNRGYEYLHIHVWIALLAGILYFFLGEKNLENRVLAAGVFGACLSLAAVAVLTNREFTVSVAHAGVGAVFAFALGERAAGREGGNSPKVLRGFGTALLVFCIAVIGAKGYTLRDGKDFNNVLQSRARIIYGPAAGCVTNFDTAQIYNRTYEMWENAGIKEEKLLVVTFHHEYPVPVYRQ